MIVYLTYWKRLFDGGPPTNKNLFARAPQEVICRGPFVQKQAESKRKVSTLHATVGKQARDELCQAQQNLC